MPESETPVGPTQPEQSAPSGSDTPVVPVVSSNGANTDQQSRPTVPLPESQEGQQWAQPFGGYASSPRVVDTEPTLPPPATSAAYPSDTPYTLYAPYPPYSPAAATRHARPHNRTLLGSARVWASIAGLAIILCLLVSAFAIGHITATGAANNGNTSASSQTSQTTASAPTVAVAPSAQDLQQTVVNVVKTVQPAVVEVTSTGSAGEAIGSGDVIRSDGYIVTNDHVIAGFSNYTVTFANGKTMAAQVVGQDAQDDLAVLKVNATGLQTLAIANSNTVQVGQFAIAVGSPLGLQQSASFGIVSALNRTESEGQGGPASILTGLVQTSAPINPGNSGGALVNLQGQLIGIPTLGASNTQTGGSADGIGFAIPASRVSFVTTQLIATGHLTHTGQGFLGIQGQDVNAGQSTATVASGVQVVGFASDASGASPAQQAGLQSGDVILAVNGQAIASQADLAGLLLNQAPGTKVTLTIARNGAQQTIQVTLGERPVSAQG